MTLDNDFKEQTEKLVTETLELYKSAGASPRIGDVWKCESTGDFLCGFFVGEMVGSALSAFQVQVQVTFIKTRYDSARNKCDPSSYLHRVTVTPKKTLVTD